MKEQYFNSDAFEGVIRDCVSVNKSLEGKKVKIKNVFEVIYDEGFGQNSISSYNSLVDGIDGDIENLRSNLYSYKNYMEEADNLGAHDLQNMPFVAIQGAVPNSGSTGSGLTSYAVDVGSTTGAVGSVEGLTSGGTSAVNAEEIASMASVSEVPLTNIYKEDAANLKPGEGFDMSPNYDKMENLYKMEGTEKLDTSGVDVQSLDERSAYIASDVLKDRNGNYKDLQTQTFEYSKDSMDYLEDVTKKKNTTGELKSATGQQVLEFNGNIFKNLGLDGKGITKTNVTNSKNSSTMLHDRFNKYRMNIASNRQLFGIGDYASMVGKNIDHDLSASGKEEN